MKNQSIEQRFMAKVDQSEDCWEWTGYRTPDGYGRFQVVFSRMAHRISYELFVGPIPEGLEIDHLCSNRACVNPTHLEPVTRKENLARSDVGGYNKRKTHCPQKHPYSPENTYVKKNGGRVCRACMRGAYRRYRLRLRLRARETQTGEQSDATCAAGPTQRRRRSQD